MCSVRLVSNNNLACVLVLLVTTNHGTSSSNRIASIGSLCHAVQEVALFCMTCEQTQDKAHALLMCRVSLLLRVWSPIFWVRWLPLLHLALKISQLLFWNTLTPVMRRMKMWLNLTWPTYFTLLWVKNVFLLVGKKAKISPLYKKGSKLDPNNYRMLAVSGTLYRLYANILRELVTKWCVENRKVPDTQFGFYPAYVYFKALSPRCQTD